MMESSPPSLEQQEEAIDPPICIAAFPSDDEDDDPTAIRAVLPFPGRDLSDVKDLGFLHAKYGQRSVEAANNHSLDTSSSSAVSLSRGKGFHVAGYVRHAAEKLSIDQHCEMSQKRRRNDEIGQHRRRTRAANFDPVRGKCIDGELFKKFGGCQLREQGILGGAPGAQLWERGILSGGPVVELREKGILPTKPAPHFREQGILSAAPALQFRDRGVFDGAHVSTQVSNFRGQGIFESVPATQFRELGICDGGSALQVREQQGIFAGGHGARSREQGILAGGPASRLRESGILAGVNTLQLREQGILAGVNTLQLREQRILAGGQALQMREQGILSGGHTPRGLLGRWPAPASVSAERMQMNQVLIGGRNADQSSATWRSVDQNSYTWKNGDQSSNAWRNGDQSSNAWLQRIEHGILGGSPSAQTGEQGKKAGGEHPPPFWDHGMLRGLASEMREQGVLGRCPPRAATASSPAKFQSPGNGRYNHQQQQFRSVTAPPLIVQGLLGRMPTSTPV